MKLRPLLIAALAAAPALAFATEPREATEVRTAAVSRARGEVRAALLDALEARAELPVTPPSLPDAASERARAAHEQAAFGKQGAAAREAVRAEARARGLEQARQATAGNEHAARGLDNAEAAQARGNSAAGRARAEDARGHRPVDVPRGGPGRP